MSDRAWMNKESLAYALDVSKSTVDELVRRKVIPQPTRFSSGCVRWRWDDVDRALRSRSEPPVAPEGVRDVRTGRPL